MSGYRRILFPFLAVQLVFYSTSVLVAVVFDSSALLASEDVIAAGLSAVGLIALSFRRVLGWQHTIALMCAILAPLSAALFHDKLPALLWSLIPLMLVAVYLRGVCSVVSTARAACGAVAVLAVLALTFSPAAPPVLWFLLWPACIFAASEIYGSLTASLLDGALRDPLTSVWNRSGSAAATAELIGRAREQDEQITVIVFEVTDSRRIDILDNDAAGDLQLTQLTEKWRASLPSSAVLARLGRNEFIAVLRGVDADVELLGGELASGHSVPVDYGTATGPSVPEAFAQLLLDADSDLYRRKRISATRFGSFD
ncbi:hypothetical protein BJI47_01275 [Rhodococcus sp. 1168]|nr:hypothetical protein BJI47_01275 [Rhodococcus sp. 1168]